MPGVYNCSLAELRDGLTGGDGCVKHPAGR
jgi:hypothetical protein